MRKDEVNNRWRLILDHLTPVVNFVIHVNGYSLARFVLFGAQERYGSGISDYVERVNVWLWHDDVLQAAQVEVQAPIDTV